MNMICVKSIELEVFDRDEIEYFYSPGFERDYLDIGGTGKDIKIKREMIQGRVYRDSVGREICIGMTREVQEAIGLPLEAWKRLVEEHEQKRLRINDLWERIENIKSLSFWDRLKCLFFSYRKQTLSKEHR